MENYKHNVSPKESEVYVAEIKEEKLKLISRPLESIKDAYEFIQTMKDGMYYKQIHPDAKLVVIQVIEFQ